MSVVLENVVAQESDKFTENQIDSLIHSYMNLYRIPGLSIGIVKNGNFKYEKTLADKKVKSIERELYLGMLGT